MIFILQIRANIQSVDCFQKAMCVHLNIMSLFCIAGNGGNGDIQTAKSKISIFCWGLITNTYIQMHTLHRIHLVVVHILVVLIIVQPATPDIYFGALRSAHMWTSCLWKTLVPKSDRLLLGTTMTNHSM